MAVLRSQYSKEPCTLGLGLWHQLLPQVFAAWHVLSWFVRAWVLAEIHTEQQR